MSLFDERQHDAAFRNQHFGQNVPLGAALVHGAINAAAQGRDPHDDIRSYVTANSEALGAAAAASGAVGGAWAGVTLWTANLSAAGKVMAWLGLRTVPLWAPAAGAAVGLASVAALSYPVYRYIRGGHEKQEATVRAAVAKYGIALASTPEPVSGERQSALTAALLSVGASQDELEALMKAGENAVVDLTPLSAEDREKVFRVVYPIVHAGDNPTDQQLARLESIRTQLGLADDITADAAAEYARVRLDYWSYLHEAVKTSAAVIRRVSPKSIDNLRKMIEPVVAMNPAEEAAERRKPIIDAVSTVATAAGAALTVQTGGAYTAAGLVIARALALRTAETDEEKDAVAAEFDQLLEGREDRDEILESSTTLIEGGEAATEAEAVFRERARAILEGRASDPADGKSLGPRSGAEPETTTT